MRKIGKNIGLLMDLAIPTYREEWAKKNKDDPKNFDKSIQELKELDLIEMKKVGRKQIWSHNEKGAQMVQLTKRYEQVMSQIYGEEPSPIQKPEDYDILLEMVVHSDQRIRNQAGGHLSDYLRSDKVYADEKLLKVLKKILSLHPLEDQDSVFLALYFAVENMNRNGIKIKDEVLTPELKKKLKENLKSKTRRIDYVLSFVGLLSKDDYMKFIQMIVEELSEDEYNKIDIRFTTDIKALFYNRPELRKSTMEYLRNMISEDYKKKGDKGNECRERAFSLMESLRRT